jgi:exodeoxyribonuclease-3
VMMVGDWNIAPTDDDVFDIRQFRNSTHVTPGERAAFEAFQTDGWVEVTREHDGGYTYWDYYRQRFERDRGMKIDFALATPSLAVRVTGAFVDREERNPAVFAGAPSDHAPIVIDVA